MSDAWPPPHDDDAGTADGAAPAVDAGPGDADAALLAALEADLAAVESALVSLDRIAAEGTGGEAAASEIAELVSPERFPVDDPAT